MSQYNSILVLGSTASGKTRLAVKIAAELNGEIISLDSRQVYRQLNIGTGKDLHEYFFNGNLIQHHLIDIVEPSEKYNVALFQNDFQNAFEHVSKSGKLPVLCGGTGLYMDVILKEQSYIHVPVNEVLREELQKESYESLLVLFNSQQSEYHSYADTSTHKRLVRAIEISNYLNANTFCKNTFVKVKPLVLGISTTLEERRTRIEARLQQRIDNGLIEEVEQIIERGLTHDKLQYFGLEYKFISYYLKNEITKEQLLEQLTIAIQQYAKRQMTWFRKMEREGVIINWIDRDSSIENVVSLFSK